jgi:hypothetical protein
MLLQKVRGGAHVYIFLLWLPGSNVDAGFEMMECNPRRLLARAREVGKSLSYVLQEEEIT